jgi:hypothetical protein
MRMPLSRRELLVVLGLMVAGCGDRQAQVEPEQQPGPASATTTLVVDGMI